MLSYKQWKLVNESLGSVTLGLAMPQNLGAIDFGFSEAKKSKKKMEDEPEVEVEDETGDGEVVEPSSEKDEAEDDECGCNTAMSKKKSKKSKKKMSSDEVPEDGVEVPEEDAEEEEEVPEEGDEEELDVDADGEDEEIVEPDPSVEPAYSKKKSAKKSKKKMTSEMTEEEQAWWNSVNGMLSTDNLNQKFDDGFSQFETENIFGTPVDLENMTQAVRDEPAVGNDGVIHNMDGTLGESKSFAEWVEKRNAK